MHASESASLTRPDRFRSRGRRRRPSFPARTRGRASYNKAANAFRALSRLFSAPFLKARPGLRGETGSVSFLGCPPNRWRLFSFLSAPALRLRPLGQSVGYRTACQGVWNCLSRRAPLLLAYRCSACAKFARAPFPARAFIPFPLTNRDAGRHFRRPASLFLTRAFDTAFTGGREKRPRIKFSQKSALMRRHPTTNPSVTRLVHARQRRAPLFPLGEGDSRFPPPVIFCSKTAPSPLSQ